MTKAESGWRKRQIQKHEGEKHMKKIMTERFAIVGKNNLYVKPFVDDTPYLLFKTKKDAEKVIALEHASKYKIVRVRVTIEPAQGILS